MEKHKEIEQERIELLKKQLKLKQEINELKTVSDDVKTYLRKIAQLILLDDELEENDSKILKL